MIWDIYEPCLACLGLITLHIPCLLPLEDEPGGRMPFLSWSFPQIHFLPGLSPVREATFTRVTCQAFVTDPECCPRSMCGKLWCPWACVGEAVMTSITLVPDALFSVFPSFSFWLSQHRKAVNAHWYFMGCKSLIIITKQRIKMTFFSHRGSRNLPKGFGGSKPTNLLDVLSFLGFSLSKKYVECRLGKIERGWGT